MKKIIAIGIVCLFLFTGLTTVSAIGMKADISKELNTGKINKTKNEGLPDFIVERISICYIPHPPIFDKVIKIVIANTGDPYNEYQIPIRYWFEGFHDKAVDNTVERGVWNVGDNKWAVIIGVARPGSKLSYNFDVQIDPENTIQEISKDNNFGSKSIIFPMSRYVSPLSFLQRFPILSHLLGL